MEGGYAGGVLTEMIRLVTPPEGAPSEEKVAHPVSPDGSTQVWGKGPWADPDVSIAVAGHGPNPEPAVRALPHLHLVYESSVEVLSQM